MLGTNPIDYHEKSQITVVKSFKHLTLAESERSRRELSQKSDELSAAVATAQKALEEKVGALKNAEDQIREKTLELVVNVIKLFISLPLVKR